MMSYYESPKHGDRTKSGMWVDNRPFDENIPFHDLIDAVHLPDCDVLECDYRCVDSLVSDNPIELTYNAEYGLWLCPTHWFEIEAEARPTYQPPRLTRLFTHAELTTPA